MENDIFHLDAEIARRLEFMVVPLQRYRNTLLPIAHLPNELLQSVFLLCCSRETGAGGSMGHKQPIELSHVCHTWRLLALASGRLWGDISITHPPLTTLFLSRSTRHPLRVNWSYKQEEVHNTMFSLEDYLVAFNTTLHHAERISSLQLCIPHDSISDHIKPIVESLKPRFTQLSNFYVDFSGDDDVEPISVDWFFVSNAPELTHLELKYGHVRPETVLAFSRLVSLDLPDMWHASSELSRKWRDTLVSLSDTLEVVNITANLLLLPGSDAIKLGNLTDLVLRGSIVHMQDVLIGLQTPTIRRLILHLDDYFEDNLVGAALFHPWSGIINKQLSWENVKHQESWCLTFHSSEGICLRAPDYQVSMALRCEIDDSSPAAVSFFIQCLHEEIRHAIIELELNVSQDPDDDDDVLWPMLPWAGLHEYIPNISSLKVNSAGFRSLVNIQGYPVCPKLAVLHFYDTNLSDEDLIEVTDLRDAIWTREAHSGCQSITEIRLSNECKLSRHVRNLFGSGVAVFLNDQEVEYDLLAE
jgi:hypothetical protein